VGEVRSASPDDLPALCDLLTAFVTELTPLRGASLLLEPGIAAAMELASGDTLASVLADPDQRVTVVGVAREPVAFALCRLATSEAGGSRGVIDACYVGPGSRGKGVGALLMKDALEWFSARGCDGVDGTAFPGDRQAKSFFEAAGFKARMLVMHRPLD
jgi:GNAT superfamily N-acetyltransferase